MELSAAADAVAEMVGVTPAALSWLASCALLHLLAQRSLGHRTTLSRSRVADLANTLVSSVHAASVFTSSLLYLWARLDARAPLALLRVDKVFPNTHTENVLIDRMLVRGLEAPFPSCRRLGNGPTCGATPRHAGGPA